MLFKIKHMAISRACCFLAKIIYAVIRVKLAKLGYGGCRAWRFVQASYFVKCLKKQEIGVRLRANPARSL